MEYLNDILCLEYSEFVPVIVDKRDTYQKLRERGNITVHGIGGNGRKVLIEFETLPYKYKKAVKEAYGDPYEYASKQPILNSLEWDTNAHAFYMGYELPNGDKLPASDRDMKGRAQINYVHRYTENATWLNMLDRLTTDKRALKRELNIPVMTFWQVATDMIKLRKVALPSNAKRLKEKLKNYIGQPAPSRYEYLIEKHKFGNTHSAKVADETAEAFLKSLIAHKNNHDDTVIASIYNRWAEENGRESIVPGTVSYRRKMWANELMLEREGIAKVSAKLSKAIGRDRASAPLLFVNSDDNILDAFFVDGANKWYRPALYVVIDTYNDYIIGYAWGDTITIDLIKEAYRNAQRHVMQLTGDAYCWQQLQTDRWGISGKNTTELEAFYNSMGHSTPAGLKNPNSKYIERAFGTTWHQVLKMFFPSNYSGYNIGSKSKINRDELRPSNFPQREDAGKYIDLFIEAMRRTKRNDSELSRREEWLQAFNNSPKSKKKLLTAESRLQIFGKTHSYTNQITAEGIRPTLGGYKLRYELSQEQIFEHVGKSVQVIYDEHDLSQVLLTDGKGLRIVAQTYDNVPAAFADYEAGDAERIKALQNEKKTLLPRIQQSIQERKGILERAKIDAESRLQAGVLVKEINHSDIRLLAGNSSEKDEIYAENPPEKVGLRAKNGHEKKAKSTEKQIDIYKLM